MKLAVKTPRPPMTGALRLKTKFESRPRPGRRRQAASDGDFAIAGGRFTDPDAAQNQRDERAGDGHWRWRGDAESRL
jgi:hypothetical protein